MIPTVLERPASDLLREGEGPILSPLLCPERAQHSPHYSSVRPLSLISRKVPLRGHWELCTQHGEALHRTVLGPPLPLNSPEGLSQILPPSLHLRTMMADFLGLSPSISKTKGLRGILFESMYEGRGQSQLPSERNCIFFPGTLD